MAISELKVRINAYGMTYNSIFADSHIWEKISIVESKESLSPNFRFWFYFQITI